MELSIDPRIVPLLLEALRREPDAAQNSRKLVPKAIWRSDRDGRGSVVSSATGAWRPVVESYWPDGAIPDFEPQVRCQGLGSYAA